ncbi:MAG: cytochrome P450 [Mycobacteriaceae bacterium]|nr:cytochrome P450 [Mycobacteriaceae bacterium]
MVTAHARSEKASAHARSEKGSAHARSEKDSAHAGAPATPALNPYDYDFHEDPYPFYRRLRDEAPLYHNEELGFWALSRHADVLRGFRNSVTLSNAEGVSLDPVSRGPHAAKTMSFLAMDDPGHLRLRTLVSKGFTPRRIRELEPRVTELAVRHLDTMLAMAGSGTVDYVAEFAGKLPMDVISELMGVPEPDRARIRELADGVMHREDGVTDVPASAIEASINLMVYYKNMVAERRKKPADDLTSALLNAEIDGDRLTDDEILGFMFLMVIAGNETTTKLLANAAFWGHKNPDQLTPVYADPARVPLWVEETLRYDTSSQILARTVSGELTLYDTTIPVGDVLVLLPGSAHRDERVFDDPDSYLIGRDIGSKLMSFGSGAHFCLGAHLARMEARVALVELFKRIRRYEVDEANAIRVHSSNVRGFARLPISVEVA